MVQTLEAEIAEALAVRDDTRAVHLLRLAFGAEHGGDEQALPELLEELAEYYASAGRTEDAVAAMARALEAGWQGPLDGRCRMAEFCLRGGLREEAAQLYAAVREDTPFDPCLYYAAGIDYAEATSYEQALGWLSDGVALVLQQRPDAEEAREVLAQLHTARRSVLAALGRPRDALDEEAAARLTGAGRQDAGAEAAERPGDGGRDEAAPSDAFAFPWFCKADYDEAVRTWPEFAAQQAGDREGEDASYRTYCRELERRLRALHAAAPRRRLYLAPVRLHALLAWCAARGLDCAEPASRDAFAAELLGRGEALAWPPAGDAPCWCDSGRNYDTCCSLGVD